MHITEDLIPKTCKNRPTAGKTAAVKKITIHETDNTAKGANAAAHAKYLKDGAVADKVSWHYTVDEDGAIRHIPDGETAWHSGTAQGNKSIGIELCVNKDGDFEKTFRNAAELVKGLLKKHGLGKTDIVQHYYWNKKNCPKTIRAKGRWQEFLDLATGGKEIYIYSEKDGFHTVKTDIENFDLMILDAKKKTTKIKNYFNAGFFSALANGKTIPVGNLACGGNIVSECYRNAAWINLSRKKVSTLIVTKTGAKIEKTDRLDNIEGLRCAVSGVPVLIGGREVSLSKDVKPESWFGGELSPTWHGFLTVFEGKIIYHAFKTASKTAAAATTEIYKKLKNFGYSDVIMLDGGGSFVLDVDGTNKAVTSENRVINSVGLFGI